MTGHQGSSRPFVKCKLVHGASSSRVTCAKNTSSKDASPMLTIFDDDEGLPDFLELQNANACHLKIFTITPLACENHLDNHLDVKLLDLHDHCYVRQAVVENAINKKSQELLKVIEQIKEECDNGDGFEGGSLHCYGLVHSDELGMIVGKLVSSTVFYGRCAYFKEVAKMKEPLTWTKVKGYRPSYKKGHTKAGNDLATATFPFLSKDVADPSTLIEALLLKKPPTLQRPAPSRNQAPRVASRFVLPSMCQMKTLREVNVNFVDASQILVGRTTRGSLILANRGICTPAGIAKDVFVPVGIFIFSADFVIVDYESDPRVPLILGRPFLRPARALIDVHGEEMILRDGKDSSLKDSIDQKDRANLADIFVDPIPDMFTDEHAPDDSSLSIFNVYDDDFLEVKFDAENVYDDPFNSKGEKIKESKLLIDELDLPCDFLPPFEYNSFISQDFSRVDALPSANTEDKVFNPCILIQEKPVKIITRVAQDKKLVISNASLVLEDFDPPFYEPLFFKEVPKSKMLLHFYLKIRKKFSNQGYTLLKRCQKPGHLAARLGCAETKVVTWDDLAFKLITLG
uniref:Reverse transcriptase domain-containing protein n=1 Tax=Tanacetum cinerariifolium TaxID=118510 RepID=A0A6L2KHM0_TANCI|nr:reverse transcriptase domain-containing protein [Tanacetum cinerariifolium]